MNLSNIKMKLWKKFDSLPFETHRRIWWTGAVVQASVLTYAFYYVTRPLKSVIDKEKEQSKLDKGHWECVGSGLDDECNVGCQMRWFMNGRRTKYTKMVNLGQAGGNSGCFKLNDTTHPKELNYKTNTSAAIFA